MRWLVAAVVLLACGDGDEDCQLPTLCYAMELGPGTGTCDPAMVIDLLEPLGSFDQAEVGCGRREVDSGMVSGGCTIDYRIEADLGEEGPDNGTIELAGDCGSAGADCQHSFTVLFEETPCASQ